MKTTIHFAALVALVALVIVYSCNSDTTTNTTTTNSGGSCVTSLSGQIFNWTHTGKVYLYLAVYDYSHTNRYVVDTGTINSTGAFSINLTTPPAGGLLTPVVDTTCHPTITYPAGAKLAVAFFEVYDSTNTQIGALLRSNYDTNGYAAGEFVDAFVYSTVAFTLNGTSVCGSLIHDTVNASVNGLACWNKVVILYTDVYGGQPTKISESNTEPNASAKWYYNGGPQPERLSDYIYRDY